MVSQRNKDLIENNFKVKQNLLDKSDLFYCLNKGGTWYLAGYFKGIVNSVEELDKEETSRIYFTLIDRNGKSINCFANSVYISENLYQGSTIYGIMYFSNYIEALDRYEANLCIGYQTYPFNNISLTPFYSKMLNYTLKEEQVNYDKEKNDRLGYILDGDRKSNNKIAVKSDSDDEKEFNKEDTRKIINELNMVFNAAKISSANSSKITSISNNIEKEVKKSTYIKSRNKLYLWLISDDKFIVLKTGLPYIPLGLNKSSIKYFNKDLYEDFNKIIDKICLEYFNKNNINKEDYIVKYIRIYRLRYYNNELIKGHRPTFNTYAVLNKADHSEVDEKLYFDNGKLYCENKLEDKRVLYSNKKLRKIAEEL